MHGNVLKLCDCAVYELIMAYVLMFNLKFCDCAVYECCLEL